MRRFLLPMLALTAFASSFAAGPAASPVVQWRNDGTGIFPNVKPPVHWHSRSQQVEALRFQAAPPAGENQAGSPMPDGVIREWLILGPLDTHDTKEGPGDALVDLDIAKITPRENDKVAGQEWKLVKADTSYVDFAREFSFYGKKEGRFCAYMTTCIFSPENAAFIINCNNSGAARVWINGKILPKPGEGTDISYTPFSVTLNKGWNRIVMRATPGQSDQKRGLQWYLSANFRADPRNARFNDKNIRWKTMMPAGEGFGSPIVAPGTGKIFLLSEPGDLVCVDQASGKILWVRSNNYDDCITAPEKEAHADLWTEIQEHQQKLKAINESFAAGKPPKLVNDGGRESFKEKVAAENRLYSLMKQVDDKKYLRPKGQDVGYAGFTPVTDGKHVWAWFASGVLCCYDLDGKLAWRRLDNEGSFFEHGYSTSPILIDGKIVVFMNKLIAFDAATGNRLWTTELSGLGLTRFHGTPAPINVGGTPVIAMPTGHLVRASDGKFVHDKGPDISGRQQEIPSPVVVGNTIYGLSTFSRFTRTVLPAQFADPLPVSSQSMTLDVSQYPYYYLEWFLSSPVIHDGLAYCVNNNGVLVVIDVDKMQTVYTRLLDLDHFQCTNDVAGRGIGISPALAGGNLYLFGNCGATLVLKPGRTYQEIAKNKIESLFYRYWQVRHERFVANPTFAGKDLLLRGERYLYCLSE